MRVIKAPRPHRSNPVSAPSLVPAKGRGAAVISRKSLKDKGTSVPSCRTRQSQSNLRPQMHVLAIFQAKIKISGSSLTFQRVLEVTPDSTVLVLIAAGSISSDEFLGYSVNGRATYHMRLVLWLPL